MELRDVLAALRSAWWMPVVGLLVGGAVMLGFSATQTPLYRADTQVFVSTTDSNSPSDVFQGSQFSQQRVASYAQLITGEQLAERIVTDLDLDLSPGALRAEVAAVAVTDTVLIDITVTDPSAERALRIADAIGRLFPALVDELETPAGGDVSPVRVRVTDTPDVAGRPSEPQVVRLVTLGLLGGLLLGAAAALLKPRWDQTVKTSEMASELTGAPVIGTIVRDEQLAVQHVLDQAAASRTAEDFRRLRTNLQFLSIDDPPKMLLVSSAVPSEGKTTLVINLALALVESGRTVAIVDADLRRPKISSYLRLVGSVGLTNILSGSASLEDVSQNFGNSRLRVIASGQTPPNPGELLSSGQMSTLLATLRQTHDYVLVDGPPLLPVADSLGLASHMDGVILSIRHGHTRQDEVSRSAAEVRTVGGRVLGVVLNVVQPKDTLVTGSAYDYSTQSPIEAAPAIEASSPQGEAASTSHQSRPE